MSGIELPTWDESQVPAHVLVNPDLFTTDVIVERIFRYYDRIPINKPILGENNHAGLMRMLQSRGDQYASVVHRAINLDPNVQVDSINRIVEVRWFAIEGNHGSN